MAVQEVVRVDVQEMQAVQFQVINIQYKHLYNFQQLYLKYKRDKNILLYILNYLNIDPNNFIDQVIQDQINLKYYSKILLQIYLPNLYYINNFSYFFDLRKGILKIWKK